MTKLSCICPRAFTLVPSCREGLGPGASAASCTWGAQRLVAKLPMKQVRDILMIGTVPQCFPFPPQCTALPARYWVLEQRELPSSNDQTCF